MRALREEILDASRARTHAGRTLWLEVAGARERAGSESDRTARANSTIGVDDRRRGGILGQSKQGNG